MQRGWFATCVVLLAVSSAVPVEAGHGHHHHHHGWHIDFIYGGGFYPRPWYTPYYYYPAPAPVVYVPQQVVVPSVPAVAATASAAAPSPTPVVRSSTPAAIKGVTIRNPAASGANLSFVVDSRTEVELKPGEELPLAQKEAYYVEFDRGGDFGTSKQTLTSGSYDFIGTEKGWSLQRTGTDATEPTPTPVVRRNTLPTVR